MLNTAFLSGLSQSVSVRTLVFSSDDTLTSSTSSVAISEAQESGSVTATVSSGGFSHAINFTVVRLPAPTLQVDDSELQALPGSCGGYQSTRLRALSGGVDIARLLTFQTTTLQCWRSTRRLPRGRWSLRWGLARRRCTSKTSASPASP